ncbi:MAG: hypothetical protein LBI70_01750 [Rickettsiales bacterium]|nr:hypothetical protein [Rickettsiales bacterium]
MNGANQRYYCRECRRTFTLTIRKYGEDIKLRVLKMYLENVGLRSIGRIENVHNTVVLYWIRRAGKIIKKKLEESLARIDENNLKKENIEILEIDEMVTQIKKKLKMGENIPSFGLLSIGTEIKLLILK